MSEQKVYKDSISKIMGDIVALDHPSVYSVSLNRYDYKDGFRGCAEFRGGHSPHISEVNFWAETPEEALDGLLSELRTRYGICPSCGRVIG